ncbi:hypothetical protein A5634_25565 [Mycobacterium asiaticum]|uniref:Transmembrane protein n=1 Tax=Mycobacterium asiaticum TaxID=1790 RepID=A0A1A3NUW3_MYCAS|nr:hypothetical protein [Mycobacterium asiaticum]OBK25746.1 hypothetical protein A5634_25565 [Mycobacterium asiaticum]
MTGADSDAEDTKQVTVAELLARNGSVAPAVTRRRRRRRGDDSVSVAELTGEIPVVRDDYPADAPAQSSAPPQTQVPEPAPPVAAEPPAPAPAEPEVELEPEPKSVYWAEPEPRWPKSEPVAKRKSGPERSEYPRPLRQAGVNDVDGQQSGAEGMSPDPVGHYTDASVDVMDSEVREAETAVEDSAYVRSYLQSPESDSEHTLFGGQSIADEVARRRGGQYSDDLEPGLEPGGFDAEDFESEAAAPRSSREKLTAVGRGLLTVLQSILAVVFGAGLFIAFDQLWRWNAIVALVLSVLVILGLVVGVRVVRKTEDIASTLIAVAVGALITLGPMALLQTG